MISVDNLEQLAFYLAELISTPDKLSWSNNNLTIDKSYPIACKCKLPLSFAETFSKFFLAEYKDKALKLKEGQLLAAHSTDISFVSVLLKSGAKQANYPPHLSFQVWGDGAILVKRGASMDWRLFWSHNDCPICYYRVFLPFMADEHLDNCKVEKGVFVSPNPVSGVEVITILTGSPVLVKENEMLIMGWFGFGETERMAFDRACAEKWEAEGQLNRMTGGRYADK